MVWAAEFVRRCATGRDGIADAACWAARSVEAMRSVVDSTKLDPPARRMLDDMLSNGRDR